MDVLSSIHIMFSLYLYSIPSPFYSIQFYSPFRPCTPALKRHTHLICMLVANWPLSCWMECEQACSSVCVCEGKILFYCLTEDYSRVHFCPHTHTHTSRNLGSLLSQLKWSQTQPSHCSHTPPHEARYSREHCHFLICGSQCYRIMTWVFQVSHIFILHCKKISVSTSRADFYWLLMSRSNPVEKSDTGVSRLKRLYRHFLHV